ncbi:MAG: hypothetical protein ACFE0J_05255 [Elainellaceae cyanobacterium]
MMTPVELSRQFSGKSTSQSCPFPAYRSPLVEVESFDQLIQEIGKTPAYRLREVLDFLQFLNAKITRGVPAHEANPYPVRGLPIQYIDPTEPVALEDWEALQ